MHSSAAHIALLARLPPAHGLPLRISFAAVRGTLFPYLYSSVDNLAGIPPLTRSRFTLLFCRFFGGRDVLLTCLNGAGERLRLDATEDWGLGSRA